VKLRLNRRDAFKHYLIITLEAGVLRVVQKGGTLVIRRHYLNSYYN
jgi:hypothetical protein